MCQIWWVWHSTQHTNNKLNIQIRRHKVSECSADRHRDTENAQKIYLHFFGCCRSWRAHFQSSFIYSCLSLARIVEKVFMDTQIVDFVQILHSLLIATGEFVQHDTNYVLPEDKISLINIVCFCNYQLFRRKVFYLYWFRLLCF